MFSKKPRFLWIILFLITLCAATYSNCLHNEFMIDDWDIFFNKNRIPDIGHLWRIFNYQDTTFVFFRPITNLFRSLLISFVPLNTFYYHSINIFLFSLHLILVFLILKNLFKEYLLAAIVCILICVHPINSIVVNYISAHEVLLYGIFLDLSALLFLFYIKDTKKNWLLYLSLFNYVLALFTQEIAFIYPLIPLLITLNFKENSSFLSSLKTCKLYFITASLYLISRFILIKHTSDCLTRTLNYVHSAHINFFIYIDTVFKLIFWHLEKLILPSEIIHMKTSLPQTWGTGLDITFFLLILIIIFFILRAIQKERNLFFALMWFFCGFIPVFGIALIYPYQGFTIEPHWFFFFSTGFFLFVGLLIKYVLTKSLTPFTKAIIYALLFILIFSEFSITRTYNVIWKNQKSYCSYWASISPDFFFANACLSRQLP